MSRFVRENVMLGFLEDIKKLDKSKNKRVYSSLIEKDTITQNMIIPCYIMVHIVDSKGKSDSYIDKELRLVYDFITSGVITSGLSDYQFMLISGRLFNCLTFKEMALDIKATEKEIKKDFNNVMDLIKNTYKDMKDSGKDNFVHMLASL